MTSVLSTVDPFSGSFQTTTRSIYSGFGNKSAENAEEAKQLVSEDETMTLAFDDENKSLQLSREEKVMVNFNTENGIVNVGENTGPDIEEFQDNSLTTVYFVDDYVRKAASELVSNEINYDIFLTQTSGDARYEQIGAHDADIKNLKDNISSVEKDIESLNLAVETNYLSKDTAEADYLKKEDAEDIYLAIETAESDYLKKTDAATDYLTKTDAESTYTTTEQVQKMILNEEGQAIEGLVTEDELNNYYNKEEIDEKLNVIDETLEGIVPYGQKHEEKTYYIPNEICFGAPETTKQDVNKAEYELLNFEDLTFEDGVLYKFRFQIAIGLENNDFNNPTEGSNGGINVADPLQNFDDRIFEPWTIAEPSTGEILYQPFYTHEKLHTYDDLYGYMWYVMLYYDDGLFQEDGITPLNSISLYTLEPFRTDDPYMECWGGKEVPDDQRLILQPRETNKNYRLLTPFQDIEIRARKAPLKLKFGFVFNSHRYGTRDSHVTYLEFGDPCSNYCPYKNIQVWSHENGEGLSKLMVEIIPLNYVTQPEFQAFEAVVDYKFNNLRPSDPLSTIEEPFNFDPTGTNKYGRLKCVDHANDEDGAHYFYQNNTDGTVPIAQIDYSQPIPASREIYQARFHASLLEGTATKNGNTYNWNSDVATELFQYAKFFIRIVKGDTEYMWAEDGFYDEWDNIDFITVQKRKYYLLQREEVEDQAGFFEFTTNETLEPLTIDNEVLNIFIGARIDFIKTSDDFEYPDLINSPYKIGISDLSLLRFVYTTGYISKTETALGFMALSSKLDKQQEEIEEEQKEIKAIWEELKKEDEGPLKKLISWGLDEAIDFLLLPSKRNPATYKTLEDSDDNDTYEPSDGEPFTKPAKTSEKEQKTRPRQRLAIVRDPDDKPRTLSAMIAQVFFASLHCMINPYMKEDGSLDEMRTFLKQIISSKNNLISLTEDEKDTSIMTISKMAEKYFNKDDVKALIPPLQLSTSSQKSFLLSEDVKVSTDIKQTDFYKIFNASELFTIESDGDETTLHNYSGTLVLKLDNPAIAPYLYFTLTIEKDNEKISWSSDAEIAKIIVSEPDDDKITLTLADSRFIYHATTSGTVNLEIKYYYPNIDFYVSDDNYDPDMPLRTENQLIDPSTINTELTNDKITILKEGSIFFENTAVSPSTNTSDNTEEIDEIKQEIEEMKQEISDAKQEAIDTAEQYTNQKFEDMLKGDILILNETYDANSSFVVLIDTDDENAAPLLGFNDYIVNPKDNMENDRAGIMGIFFMQINEEYAKELIDSEFEEDDEEREEFEEMVKPYLTPSNNFIGAISNWTISMQIKIHFTPNLLTSDDITKLTKEGQFVINVVDPTGIYTAADEAPQGAYQAVIEANQLYVDDDISNEEDPYIILRLDNISFKSELETPWTYLYFVITCPKLSITNDEVITRYEMLSESFLITRKVNTNFVTESDVREIVNEELEKHDYATKDDLEDLATKEYVDEEIDTKLTQFDISPGLVSYFIGYKNSQDNIGTWEFERTNEACVFYFKAFQYPLISGQYILNAPNFTIHLKLSSLEMSVAHNLSNYIKIYCDLSPEYNADIKAGQVNFGTACFDKFQNNAGDYQYAELDLFVERGEIVSKTLFLDEPSYEENKLYFRIILESIPNDQYIDFTRDIIDVSLINFTCGDLMLIPYSKQVSP